MRTLGKYLRVQWKRKPKLWLVCAAIVILALGWSVIVLVGDPEQLGVAANVGQVIGIPLAVITLVVTVLIAARPAAAAEPESARLRLARQVNLQEVAVRTTLLGSAIPIDVTFDAHTRQDNAHTATTNPDVCTTPTRTAADEGPITGTGSALRLRQMVAELVWWQRINAAPPRPDQADDTPNDAPAAGAQTNNKHQGSLLDIVGYFTNQPHRRLVIVGDKGSGKTVLVIELIVGMTQAIIDGTTATGPVPVRFSAASWTSGQSFTSWLAEQLTVTYLIPPDDARQLVDDRLVLPVLDGLDEMDPDPDPDNNDVAETSEDGEITTTRPVALPLRAAALIDALNRYILGTTFAPVVVTTRPHRHTQLLQHGLLLDHGDTIAIQPLNAHRIGSYLADRYRNKPISRAAWEPVLTRLTDPAHQGVLKFLSTPWRLMLATTAIDAAPTYATRLSAHTTTPAETPNETCERLQREFLKNFIIVAVKLKSLPLSTPFESTRHDYNPQQVHQWLSQLARHLHWQSEHARSPGAPVGMSGVDLVPHLLWPIGGHLLPRLLHLLITAALIVIGFTLDSPPDSWADNIQSWGQLLATRQWAPAVGLALVVIFFGVGLYLLSSAAWTKWPIPMISIHEKTPIRSRATSIMAGLATGLAIGLAGWLADGLVTGLLLGLMVALGLALTLGLAAGRRSWEPVIEVASPHRAVHSDLAVRLTIGLTAGLALGFGLGLGLIAKSMAGFSNELTSKIATGLGLGLAVGLAYGLTGGGGTRYMFGTTLAALRGRLPWRFAAFCRWACAAGLLRVAGAGYQFRHRELQEWLTNAPTSETPGPPASSRAAPGNPPDSGQSHEAGF